MINLHCRSFAYDDGPVLSGIDLTVAAGESVLIVGASGSGKTTVARLLAGQTGAESGAHFIGSLTLAEEQLKFNGLENDPRIDPAMWSAQVGYVAQNAWAQLSMMSGSVGEEIAFGLSNRGVPAERLRSVVRQTADRLNLGSLLERDPRRLSGGQLQKTIIAAAVASNPELLILDEPFQGLDPEGRKEVAAVLAALRAGGTAVVVLEPLLPTADGSVSRVVALCAGRTVFSGPLAAAHSAGLQRYGIGAQEMTGTAGGRSANDGHRPAPTELHPSEAAASLEAVQFTYPKQRSDADGGVRPAGLDWVSLQLSRGEAVALLGSNGSGKTTLLQHLNGLLRPQTGAVELLGRSIDAKATGELAGTVGMLFQNTDQQLFERTVRREVAYGPAAAGATRAEARRRAGEALAKVALERAADLHPHDLSFAERRLVALASLMAAQPLIWALDEPTAGLDERGRDLVAGILGGHLDRGGAVLMATHDIGFARAVCHRAVTLRNGRIVLDTPIR